jgi:hypothetical protein
LRRPFVLEKSESEQSSAMRRLNRDRCDRVIRDQPEHLVDAGADWACQHQYPNSPTDLA